MHDRWQIYVKCLSKGLVHHMLSPPDVFCLNYIKEVNWLQWSNNNLHIKALNVVAESSRVVKKFLQGIDLCFYIF